MALLKLKSVVTAGDFLPAGHGSGCSDIENHFSVFQIVCKSDIQAASRVCSLCAFVNIPFLLLPWRFYH